MIMVSVTSFFIRFIFFLLKIIVACLFVMILQVQVGQKSIEQWLEKSLKESAVSRYLTQTAVTGMELLSQKVPALKLLIKDGNVQQKENFDHNFVKQQMQEVEQKLDDLDSHDDSPQEDAHRIPSSPPPLVEEK